MRSAPTGMPPSPLGEPCSGPDRDQEFWVLRPDLVRLAAVTLGSATDAEDVVQDAWLRWREHAGTIRSSSAWLRTVTRNLAIDRIRERRHESRAELDDELLPKSVVDASQSSVQAFGSVHATDDVAHGVSLVLGRLSPLERAVFVLRDGLGWSYADIARLLARSVSTVRQLQHRARGHIAGGVPRFMVTEADRFRVSRAYLDVCAGADVSVLLDVLAPDLPLVPPGFAMVDQRLVHSVAGIVLRCEDRLLLCHRRRELGWYPDVWDVAGGHLDPVEPAAARAVRAAKEELGVVVSRPDHLGDVVGDDHSLALFASSDWDGDVRNRATDQHDTVGFFTRAEAAVLPLADRRILGLFDTLACA